MAGARKTSREIFEQAWDIENPTERRAFLVKACGPDEVLLQEVEELLRAHDGAGRFLENRADPAGGGVPAAEQVGNRIDRYKLLQKIGEGGMGTVYMAQQEEPVRRRVALKIIKLGMDTKQVVTRFEAERQALALMDHPNIARVLDGGATESGRPYFVMELVHGVPITEFCDRNQLSLRARLDLFLPVCQAIQSAHQKGIIHRDIKPSNVMVTLSHGEPTPKVIDFGVAKAIAQKLTEKTLFTHYGMMIGTPAYMSPEQAEMTSLDVDLRTDVYSLGVLLYELLTGTTPFPEQRLRSLGYGQIQKVIAEEEPEKPSTRMSTLAGEQKTLLARGREAAALAGEIRGDLDWIVMKCLEKDRRRRYDTPNELAADLRRHLTHEPVLARPPSVGYRFQKAWQRNKLALVTAGLVAGALVAGTVASAWQAVRAKQAREDAEAVSKFLIEVFQSPDPYRVGRDITVVETLDAAARKLATDLADQPARQAGLRATIGSTYNGLGYPAKAIPLLEQAQAYRLATAGPEHPDALAVQHQLALAYRESGRPADAITLQEEVLRLRLKLFGPEHPDTLAAMSQLGSFYYLGGHRDKALPLKQEVLVLSLKALGPEHPDTLLAMQNLAVSYHSAGRQDEALKMREELLPLRRKINGPEHPQTIRTLHDLGTSYFRLGRLDEALKLREQVLTLRRKVLGPEHSDTLMAMDRLAASYENAGRADEAARLRTEAQALREKQ